MQNKYFMLVNKIKQILSSQFIRNVSWLGSAELFNRIFRLATTVTLARTFSSQDYGLMAVIYTIFEFTNVLSLKGGIGAKIVQTDEQDLKMICDTSYWLNWIMCGSIFIVQCFAAFPIASFYGDDQLVLPLCITALVYLMLPLYAVQTALIERENRLKIIALCNTLQSFFINSITVVLALSGMGIWAIVWAMILPTPVWIIITWMNHSWRPPKSFKISRWQEVVIFGRNILGVELLNKLRMNIDYLIVGKFLSIKELGIYYFAFNAGSGITSNVVYAFMAALFPHICAVRQNYNQFKDRYLKNLKMIGIFVITVATIQTSLAPFYVPIIFGQKWTNAIPILMTICLSVIPLTFRWASALLLKAVDKTDTMLYFDIFYTFIFASSLLVAVRWGVFGVAVTVLIIHSIMSLIFSLWAFKSVFAKSISASS
ncbi:MAG: lipopolysaccharide biosynthesis protein [Coleofasciculaceae cyanobacterium]